MPLAPLILALAAQVAAAAGPPAPAPGTPPAKGSWSFLTDPCARANGDASRDIIVCGRRDQIQPRLPLPQYRGVPDHPTPSNPEMTAATALDGPGIGGECGGYGEDCPIFGGAYIYPKLESAVVDTVKRAFAKHYPKQGRQAIDLDAPPPAGKLEP